MALDITEKKEEKMLFRTAINAELRFEAQTPSYGEVAKELASQLKAEEKLIAIRHIYTAYGNTRAKVIAYLYHDETKKQIIEPKVKEKKVAAK